MREEVEIQTADPQLVAWNGERARIVDVYTMHNGQQAAILAFKRIACHVIFPLSDLRKLS